MALLLGMGESSPEGRRVVSGKLTGYAVRSHRYIDVGIREIRTWRYGPTIEAVEAFPPHHDAILRVAVQGSIAATLDAIRSSSEEGRAILPAVEVPHSCCPNCRYDLEQRHPFCPSCGYRVRLGWNYGRSDKPPTRAERGKYCRGCWLRHSEKGRFCVYCGYDREADDRAQILVGRRVDLMLTDGRRRIAPVNGEVAKASYMRIFRSCGPQLVLRLRAVSSSASSRVPALPEAFETWVVVSLFDDDVDQTVERMLAGARMNASEVIAACTECGSAGRRAAKVRNLHCAHCGSRQRIASVASDTARPGRIKRRGVVRHECGEAVRPRDLFCGGCGESLATTFCEETAAARAGVWGDLAATGESEIELEEDLAEDALYTPRRRRF